MQLILFGNMLVGKVCELVSPVIRSILQYASSKILLLNVLHLDIQQIHGIKQRIKLFDGL